MSVEAAAAGPNHSLNFSDDESVEIPHRNFSDGDSTMPNVSYFDCEEQ